MSVALASLGAQVMPAADLRRRLGCGDAQWARFAAHWDELAPDDYAAGSGTHRMRRYGQFELTDDGTRRPLPHQPFRQPTDTNRLFPDQSRDFAPLTGAFAADPVLAALLELLAECASVIEHADRWHVHVHPFRVLGAGDSLGEATPEGRHQDGVTLVSSLLIARRNATGGRSSVFAQDGREILGITLSEPGTLLLGDDRRTWHSVGPIRPVEADGTAVRDVLVTTLTAR